MIIIIYSETSESLVATRLGEAEYSYYFVLKEFRPVLERLGQVILVRDPKREVDAIYHDARRRREPCVFLSFSPPHRTPLGLACPTIPVFAWEFDTIPNETWYGEPQQDWRFVLNNTGRAITHSAQVVDAVRAELGPDFPIADIPAPVWDRFAPFYHQHRSRAAWVNATVSVRGKVLDTRDPGSMDTYGWREKQQVDIDLEGIVYLSILNPHDGRKNVFDMIGAFCRAFRDIEDATLVLKLTHRDLRDSVRALLDQLDRLAPFKCRILLITGFLDAEMYDKLVSAVTFGVNTSHGEGQCLPLMETMACGKPAVTPCHSGIADYATNDNAFLVRSNLEPTCWPHDPRQASRALRNRIDFESLVEAYLDSYNTAKTDPARYARMAEHAHQALRRRCSIAVTEERLSSLLAQPPRTPASNASFGKIKSRVDAPWAVEISGNFRVLVYGPELDLMALSLARLGARVDAVSASREFNKATRLLAQNEGLELVPFAGEFGVNPADIPHAYDLILFYKKRENVRALKSTIPRLRAMLASSGKVLMFRDAVCCRRERYAAWNIRRDFEVGTVEPVRARWGLGVRDEEVVQQFEGAGFSFRRYDSPLNNRTVTICEFGI